MSHWKLNTMVILKVENNETQEIPNSNHLKQSGNILGSEKDKTFQHRYNLIYTIFQTIGVLIILSVFFWLQYYHDGFGISDTPKVCNWHPMLMTISLIYLFSNSILHFRNFRNCRKKILKIQHAVIHSCVIILAVFGIWAGINSNTIAQPPIPKFYSLHSWLGIVTMVMLLFQFASGFVSFLYPEIAMQYKEALMPYHVFFGIVIFVLSIITSVLGFSEKIIFALKQQCEYMATEGLFLNFVGIIIIVYCVLVVYILIKLDYKRSPKLDDSNGHII